MKKLLPVFVVAVLALMLSVSGVVAGGEGFCNNDFDDGIDVWNGGYTENEDNTKADDCDGESDNLKEYYCDGDRRRHENVNCGDFGAVCVSVGDRHDADYCACPEGNHFDEKEEQCVPDEVVIPEFSGIAGGIALAGAGAGYILLRRRK